MSQRTSKGGLLFFSAAAVETALLLALVFVSTLSVPGNPLRFATLGLLASGAYLLALRGFDTVHARWRPLAFWVFAILLRLVLLACTPGDDIWRYLWEGTIQNQGFSPYALSPLAPQLESLRTSWWPLINHPEWSAIYPPGAELLFAKMAAISATPLFFKLIFATADLGIILVLLRLNTGPRRHRDTAWYAWNPLVAYVFAGGGHFDSVMLLALMLALWALHRAKPVRNDTLPAWGWAAASGLFLGLAISFKLVPIFLLPVWVFALHFRFLATVPGLLLPVLFAFLCGFPKIPVFQAASEFASVARVNDLFWWIPELVFGPPAEGRNTLYLKIAVIIAILCAVIFRKDWRRAVLWILGSLLVLSPALHPWYITWILPLAAWRGTRAWFIFSISIFAYFLLWESLPGWTPWQEPLWLRLAILLPPLAWAAWESHSSKIESHS